MDDILREILIDMLVCLESGDDVKYTSILHEEFKTHMLHNNHITKEELKDRVENPE